MPTRRPGAFDLANLYRGVSKDLGLHSDTIDAVCRKLADARDTCFPATPRWRSLKKNLDFVPLGNFDRPARFENGALKVLGRSYFLWYSRPIPESGRSPLEFSTDARGRCYVNTHVEMPEPERRSAPAVGIDLGLKNVVAPANGFKIAASRFTRQEAKQLGVSQRRGESVRASALAAKIRNRRRHFLHVLSHGIVQHFGKIYVGDPSAKKPAKTRTAKFVNDAGLSMLCGMLSYKSIGTGSVTYKTSERYISQTCSCILIRARGACLAAHRAGAS